MFLCTRLPLFLHHFSFYEFKVPSITGVESTEPSLWVKKLHRRDGIMAGVRAAKDRWSKTSESLCLLDSHRSSSALLRITSFLILCLRLRSQQFRAQIRINWPGWLNFRKQSYTHFPAKLLFPQYSREEPAIMFWPLVILTSLKILVKVIMGKQQMELLSGFWQWNLSSS